MLSASTSNSCAMGEDGSSPDSSGFIVGAANPSATDATAGASAGVGAASASADGGGDDGGGAAGAAAAAAAAGGDWGELEGFDELDEDARRHHQAFYNDLIPHVNSQAIHTRLFHKRKYLKILEFFKKVQQGMKQRQLFLEGYTQAYNWYDRYDVFTRDNGTDILVEKPNGKEPNELLDVATWKQVTYYERLFKDLAQIHNKDHSKGGTFYKIVHEYHPSVPRTITAMFCKTCPYCLGRLKGKKPAAAGVVPNLTEGGFNSCGQIELIDFQPQKDGKFRFLLCYIDHGVKKISCAPLVSKRARTVAWALYKIFADQGAPDGLLTGTGGKHSDSAMDNNFRRVDLSSKEMDDIIKELKRFWPAVTLARGCHTEPKDRVERMIRSVHEKLIAWMIEQQSPHWSVGCYDVQWRINTQCSNAPEQTPYFKLFGHHPRMNISHSSVNPNVLDHYLTEAELSEVVEK